MRWHVIGFPGVVAIAYVSIPKRVSDALARLTSQLSAAGLKFQSLRGFPMRWHASVVFPNAVRFLVSIPKRVSDALALVLAIQG